MTRLACQPTTALLRVSLPALLVSALIFLGCEIEGPAVVPETSVNQTIAVIAEVGSFHINDHVAGFIQLALPTNLQTFEIRRVMFLVDTVVVGIVSYPPYTCSIDTRNFPEGNHLLTLAVYEMQPSLGMHNLLDMPRLLCATPLVFDQTPPAAVDGIRISYDGSTLIQWNPTTCPSFKEYIVGASVSSMYLAETVGFRDTIRNRATTSWRINTSAFPPGATISFTITVDNGAQVGPYNFLTGVVGTPIPIASPIVRFWNHPTRNETYAWTQEGRMYVLNAKGDSVLRMSALLTSGNVIFNQDGSRFYIFNSGTRTIVGFFVDDFAPVLPSITLPSDVSISSAAVLSPNGRFYVGNHDGKIWAIDQNTGTVVGMTTLAYNAWDTPHMVVSRDSSYLYCTDKQNGISKINIRNAVPVVERRADIGGSIFDLGISLDDRYLIATSFSSASVYLLNPSDLSLAAELPLPGPPCYREYYGLATYSKSFVCDGTSLFVASQARYISQFDLTSRTLVGRWCVINDPKCMGVARDGRSLLLGTLGDVPSQNLLLTR